MQNFTEGQTVQVVESAESYTGVHIPAGSLGEVLKLPIAAKDRVWVGFPELHSAPLAIRREHLRAKSSVRAGDELDIQVTVSGEVWEDIDGHLRVGDNGGYPVDDDTVVLSHRPAPDQEVVPEEGVLYEITLKGSETSYLATYSELPPWGRGYEWETLEGSEYSAEEVESYQKMLVVNPENLNRAELRNRVSNALFDRSASLAYEVNDLADLEDEIVAAVLEGLEEQS